MNCTTIAAAALCTLLVSSANADSATIAYWPFGNSGFADVSGNGHDLVGNGGLPAPDGGYVTLDGTSQFLTTASALDLSGETAVTFECWTRSIGKKSGFGILFSTPAPAGTSAGSFVMYYTGRLQSQFGMGTGWQVDYTESQSAMDDSMWHHVAYVVDRSQTGENATRLYLDGVQMKNAGGQTGAVPTLLSGVFHIGGGSGYAKDNNFFTGYIDDVRISRGALTPDQFLKFPSVGKAMRADDGKLPVVAYWPFGGKGGKDATGNGFDLTMSGVPMTSGTPSPSYNDYAKTNYYNGTFPFSAFSKTGLTIECYALTGSSGGGMAGSLIETSTLYYNNTGAFQLRFEASSSYKTATAYFLASGKEGASPKYVRSPTSEELFGALNDNRWRHYAIVYDPSKKGAGIVTLYVDGVAAPVYADNADQGPFALRDDKLYITRRGVSNDRGGAPFYGSLDDVRITAAVLTPDQFLPARSANSTVALYRFDRETLADQSGNGNDLVHCHDASVSGSPTFGAGGYVESGTGLILTGNNGTKDWVKTALPLDLSGTKAVTFEIDYNSETPSGSANYFLVGSENPTAANGNVTYLDAGKNIHGQTRKADGSGWRSLPKVVQVGKATNGCQRVRYVVNGNNAGQSYYTLNVDGTSSAANDAWAIGGLGNQALCMGHSPNYVQAYWMKGKILRVAVSDLPLGAADFVLDNIVLDTPKATLAYWSFKNGDAGLASDGVSRRRGALNLDGASSASTTNLTLSALTQATIECFVCFGETPSSGAVFSLGSGAGSFSVAADATAGTLSGTFIPYDHLAASNGGTAALAPLAGKKTWHHVALVIDRTNPGAHAVRFYVDYERTMPAGRAWDASARMLDGSIAVGDGFTGMIDDLRVSAGALSPQEFLQDRTEVQDGMVIMLR